MGSTFWGLTSGADSHICRAPPHTHTQRIEQETIRCPPPYQNPHQNPIYYSSSAAQETAPWRPSPSHPGARDHPSPRVAPPWLHHWHQWQRAGQHDSATCREAQHPRHPPHTNPAQQLPPGFEQSEVYSERGSKHPCCPVVHSCGRAFCIWNMSLAPLCQATATNPMQSLGSQRLRRNWNL